MASVVVRCTIADDTANQNSSADPCLQVMCDRGRMCVSTNGISTTCVCPESCNKEYDPVCSAYNRQFNNTCEMHRFACRFGFFTSVKNKGDCSRKEQGDKEHCPIDQLLEFHERYLLWLLISYNEEHNIKNSADMTPDDMDSDERKRLIEFEFVSRDKNSDGVLDFNEVKEMVDEREPCMVAFLHSCDFDGVDGISHNEWNTCFPSKLEEFDNEES